MIYFVRHGETTYNAAGLWMGQSDIELNRVGERQVYALSKALAHFKILTCVTSPLIRAKATASILTDSLGLPKAITMPGLAERRLGELEGQPKTEHARSHLDLYQGVENIRVFHSRIATAMESVIQLQDCSGPQSNIVIVSHFGVFRALKEALGYRATPNLNTLKNGHYVALTAPLKQSL